MRNDYNACVFVKPVASGGTPSTIRQNGASSAAGSARSSVQQYAVERGFVGRFALAFFISLKCNAAFENGVWELRDQIDEPLL